MCTSSGSMSFRAVAMSAVLPVPRQLGVALAQVERQHVVGTAELLALVPADRELRQRSQARRRVRGSGELDSFDVAEDLGVRQRAVAAEQGLLAARLQL